MTIRTLALAGLAALTLIAGCSQTPVLYPVPKVDASDRVRISYRSVLVLEVSLPTYGSTEDIAIARGDGSLEAVDSGLWADDPVRSVTLAVARNLRQLTGVIVAPEPWPFLEPPAVTVDIRIEEIVAEPQGRFRLTGQYFAAPDSEARRPRANLFDLSVPYDPEGGLAAIARARGEAILALARLVAREGLR